MSLLEEIKAPVAGELERYEVFLRETLNSQHSMTQAMIDYVIENRGKAVRPLLVLLSAAVVQGGVPLPQESLTSAMLVEMIHTASLVHDDVIDEAYIRRGKPSVKALWRTPRAVLIGDYILARSFSVAMDSRAYDVIHFIMNSMTDLCEGELLQSEQSERLEMTREIYDRIIYKKTASLMGTSSGVGAMSAGASQEVTENMRRFGDSLGMAFQIKDDILDYTRTAKTGKPMCGDLRERKITLPLLTVMEISSDAEKKKIIRLLSDVRNTPANAEYLCDYVVSRGGLQMAREAMNQYIQTALDIVGSFPASPYRESLESLCGYFADRDK